MQAFDELVRKMAEDRAAKAMADIAARVRLEAEQLVAKRMAGLEAEVEAEAERIVRTTLLQAPRETVASVEVASPPCDGALTAAVLDDLVAHDQRPVIRCTARSLHDLALAAVRRPRKGRSLAAPSWLGKEDLDLVEALCSEAVLEEAQRLSVFLLRDVRRDKNKAEHKQFLFGRAPVRLGYFRGGDNAASLFDEVVFLAGGLRKAVARLGWGDKELRSFYALSRRPFRDPVLERNGLGSQLFALHRSLVSELGGLGAGLLRHVWGVGEALPGPLPYRLEQVSEPLVTVRAARPPRPATRLGVEDAALILAEHFAKEGLVRAANPYFRKLLYPGSGGSERVGARPNQVAALLAKKELRQGLHQLGTFLVFDRSTDSEGARYIGGSLALEFGSSEPARAFDELVLLAGGEATAKDVLGWPRGASGWPHTTVLIRKHLASILRTRDYLLNEKPGVHPFAKTWGLALDIPPKDMGVSERASVASLPAGTVSNETKADAESAVITPDYDSGASSPSLVVQPQGVYECIGQALRASHKAVLFVGGMENTSTMSWFASHVNSPAEWVDLYSFKGGHRTQRVVDGIKAHRYAAVIVLEGLLPHVTERQVWNAAREAGVPAEFGFRGGAGRVAQAILQLKDKLVAQVGG